MAPNDLLTLICTYNEAANLPQLLPRLREHAPQADVLIVDDGSRDGTHPYLESIRAEYPRLEVINRGRKRGLGTAIRDGLVFAGNRGYAWCLNLDADLSHDPADIPKLLAERQADPTPDLVIGSRYVSGGGLRNCSWKRKLTSKTVNVLARRMIGWPFGDCSSAFRCYRMDAIAKFDLSTIENPSYGFLEEILCLMWRQGMVIREVPIVYTEREAGKSKISASEAWQTLTTLSRLARWRPSALPSEP